MTTTTEGGFSPEPVKRTIKPRPKGLSEAQYFALALKEGHAMLDAEEKAQAVAAAKKTPKPSVTPSPSKVQDALAKTSTNPYLRARATLLDQMLPSYRLVIEKMENGTLTKDTRYDSFVREVTELGDKISSKN